MKFSKICLTLLLVVSTHAFAVGPKLTQTASNKRACSQKISEAFLKEMQRQELKPVSVQAQDGNGNARDIGRTSRTYDVLYVNPANGLRFAAQMRIAFEPNKSGVKCHPVSVDVYGESMTAFHWPQNVNVADSSK